MTDGPIPWDAFVAAAKRVTRAADAVATGVTATLAERTTSGRLRPALRDVQRLAASARDGSDAAADAGALGDLATAREQLDSAAIRVKTAAGSVAAMQAIRKPKLADAAAAVLSAVEALRVAKKALVESERVLTPLMNCVGQATFRTDVADLASSARSLRTASRDIAAMQGKFDSEPVVGLLVPHDVGMAQWIAARAARGAVQYAFAAVSAGRVVQAAPRRQGAQGGLSPTDDLALERNLAELTDAAAQLDSCDALSVSLGRLLPKAAGEPLVREWFPVDPEMVPLKSSGLIPDAMTPDEKVADAEKKPEDETFDALVKKLLAHLASP